MRWRWQEDSKPGTPQENMAADQALFDALLKSPATLPIVHVYHWGRPSVSIGRLQDEHAVRRVFPGLELVRRPTGGRAVVHGEDVTISVVAQNDHLPATQTRGVLSSYRRIVSGIIQAFSAVGVMAEFGTSSHHSDSVDCFAESARCDVVEALTGKKLVGCAQRRENGVILQQMSVPLREVPDEALFLRAVKVGLGHALGVTEWLSVDTPFPV